MKEPQLHVLPELEGLLLFAKEGPVQFRANYRYDWAALVAPMLALRDLVVLSLAR